ncbi:MAG: ATP-binding cassette domain-containing protein [Thermoplasmatota archaeon]
MKPVFTAKNVSKSFRNVQALDKVSFSLPPGLSLLLGPNGSGKTTLIRIASSLLRPDSGKVKLLGYDPFTEFAKIVGNVTFAFQKHPVPPSMEVRNFLSGIANERGEDEYDDIIDVFKLEEYLDKQFKHLSGGFKRRVTLAQAFIGDPKFVIVDEPFANLDLESRFHISNLINKIADEQDVSLLVVTHLLSSLEADHVTLLYSGQVALSEMYSNLDLDTVTSYVLEKDGKQMEVKSQKKLKKLLNEGADLINVNKKDFNSFLEEKFVEERNK